MTTRCRANGSEISTAISTPIDPRNYTTSTDATQTGIGIKLQRLDSDIAEQVMGTMMVQGFLVLPVHDSFVVWDNKIDLLRQAMQDAYVERMGAEISTKADTAWIEAVIPAEAYELNAEGAYNIEDTIADLPDSPEFTRYRKRQRDFLATMGEARGHRRSFLPL
jgi:hypothetical protein